MKTGPQNQFYFDRFRNLAHERGPESLWSCERHIWASFYHEIAPIGLKQAMNGVFGGGFPEVFRGSGYFSFFQSSACFERDQSALKRERDFKIEVVP